MQFLALRAQGYTNQRIAQECYCAQKTVEHTLVNARVKLGAGNVVQAIFRAIALEILILTADGEVLIPERFNHLSAV